MVDETPDAHSPGEIIRRFEADTNIEVIIHGDEPRTRLARRVIQQWEAISKRAIHLLESFMRDRGTFGLESIEVFAAKTPEAGDFALRYTFTGERDPHEYNYTYFEVYFLCQDPPLEPFWPFKFTVGFH